MSKIQWSPIEEFDEDDVVCAVHIMPVVMNEGFDTEQEAWDFLKKVEDAGLPCLTDEDGMIMCTYFGHTVKGTCSCCPTLQPDTTLPTYFHKTIQ